MNARRRLGWLCMGMALVGAGVLGSIRDNAYAGDVTWETDYQHGAAEAKRSHQPMLITFRSPGCDWCRKMDAEAYTDPAVVALTHRYVCVRVNSLTEPELVRQFHINQFPAACIVGSKGTVLSRIDGFADARIVAAELTRQLPVKQRP